MKYRIIHFHQQAEYSFAPGKISSPAITFTLEVLSTVILHKLSSLLDEPATNFLLFNLNEVFRVSYLIKALRSGKQRSKIDKSLHNWWTVPYGERRKFNKEKSLLSFLRSHPCYIVSVMKKIVYVQLFLAERWSTQNKENGREERRRRRNKIENKRKTDFLFELMFTYNNILYDISSAIRSFLFSSFLRNDCACENSSHISAMVFASLLPISFSKKYFRLTEFTFELF